MKKILIWDERIPLKNIGGPCGYLFQIKQFLIENPEEQIIFLSDCISRKNQVCNETCNKQIGLFDTIKSNRLISRLRKNKLYEIFRLTHRPFSKEILNQVDLGQFTHIHFHVSLDFYNARHLLKEYNGCIVLTSHSPEPIYSEIVSRMFISKSLLSTWAQQIIKKAEIWAFRNADKIMFPVPEAIEPYYHDKDIKKILLDRKADLLYCPTAILPKDIDNSFVINFRRNYNIPNDAFIVSYIGRHNSIKGYDLLKNIAEKVLAKYSNVYFVIAGAKGPIEELCHKRWIELGWTDKANEIIKASDLFILPNRETYFDLVTLEVLRSGTPILMSLTGGNKYFQRMYPNHKGFSFFNLENLSEVLDLIGRLIEDKKNGKMEELRTLNINLWRSDFVLSEYMRKYLSVL